LRASLGEGAASMRSGKHGESTARRKRGRRIRAARARAAIFENDRKPGILLFGLDYTAERLDCAA